jgi:hypothetical protein
VYKLGSADLDPDIAAARFSLSLASGFTGYELTRGEYAAGTIRASLLEPGPFQDLAGTGWALAYLVSRRFREVMTSRGLTGWTTLDLDMSAVSEASEASYKLLVITGRAGSVHKTADGLGIAFDPQTWDRSDLFMLDGHGAILLTARAAEALYSAHLSNLVIGKFQSLERLP